jgi:hypothetical protein
MYSMAVKRRKATPATHTTAKHDDLSAGRKPDPQVREPDAKLAREQQIRLQAYHIWKEAGEPQGRHEEHWTLAEHALRKVSAT